MLRTILADWLRRLADRIVPTARAGARAGFRDVTKEPVTFNADFEAYRKWLGATATTRRYYAGRP